MRVRNQAWWATSAALLAAVAFGCSSSTSTSDAGTGPGTDGGPGTDAGSTDAGHPADAGHDAGPAGPNVGTACTANSMCTGTGATCLTNSSFPGGYCSADCMQDMDCGANGACVTLFQLMDGGVVNNCIETCTSTCSRSGYSCVGGLCVKSCTGNTDCGSAGSCQSVGADAGSACFPSCTSNDQCPAAFICDTSTSSMTSGQCIPAPLPMPQATGGALTKVVDGQNGPFEIAAGGSNLYFTQLGSPANVQFVPMAGGTVTSLASGQSIGPIATDGKNVYWVDQGTFNQNTGASNGDGAVLQAPLGGGTVVTVASKQNVPGGVATDGTNVYWTNSGTSPFVKTDGAVLKAPVGGGTATTLASNQASPAAIAVDGNNVYWANQGSVTLSRTSASYNNDGAVLQIPLAGGTATTLASKLSVPSAVAVDATGVYYLTVGTITVTNQLNVTPKTGTVDKVAIGGGTPTTLAMAQDIPQSMVVKNGNVFWTNGGSAANTGTLSMVASGSTTSNDLVTVISSPIGLALSGNDLYYTAAGTSSTNGAIWKFTPQ